MSLPAKCQVGDIVAKRPCADNAGIACFHYKETCVVDADHLATHLNFVAHVQVFTCWGIARAIAACCILDVSVLVNAEHAALIAWELGNIVAFIQNLCLRKHWCANKQSRKNENFFHSRLRYLNKMSRLDLLYYV